MDDKQGMKRRSFLKKSALCMTGAGLLNSTALLKGEGDDPAEKELKVKNYRVLGRTGFKVSDISSGGTTHPAVLKALLHAGVNYIDTAESYGAGQSEKNIGEAIGNMARKSLFITSKLSLRRGDSKENILQRTLYQGTSFFL